MTPIRWSLWAAAGVAVAILLEDQSVDIDNMTPRERENLQAFLDLLAEGEGGAEGYNALVGGGRFEDMSDHPAVTGEFAGIRRSDDGRLTTAAGRYQITRTTWTDLGGRSRFGSFEPKAQDDAAIALIKRRGALNHVIAGHVTVAANALRSTWEMFMQAKWSDAAVIAEFEQNGGTFVPRDGVTT